MQKTVTRKLFGLISCVNIDRFAFLASITLQQTEREIASDIWEPRGVNQLLLNFIKL